jgi:hemoglobin-like flavoprotein
MIHPPASTLITLQQKQLIRISFECVQEYSYTLTKLFYGRLFELQPATRLMFRNSIEEQSRKLLDTLAIVINALDDFECLRPMLAELGRRHVTYGVQAEHYEIVRTALLWALAQALEQEFDAETRAAWDHMLRAISAAMLDEHTPTSGR